MKILWLASWYPNPYEPVNGDFIQRHAQAVAELIPIDVIHVLQTGHKVLVKKEGVWLNKNANLTEYIYAFKFEPQGSEWTDKIRYNLLYHRYYKKVITQYLKEKGKPDLIHVHVPVKAGLIAIAALKKYGIPFLVSEQSSHYEEASPDYFFKRSRYFQRNTKKVFEQAATVTNVSATIGKKLQSLFRIKNYHTIHNLVDTNLFFCRTRQDREKFRFLHVSSMNEQKNPGDIIKALSVFNNTNKNWECIFCGPLREDLRALSVTLQIANKIQFTGEIPYREVALQMQLASVFVLFSNHENFPCVVVEALCCGLPVITANAGGVAEAVNEQNGIIVPVGNTAFLTDAMYKVAGNIAAYDRKTIALNAAEKYNKRKIALQFTELYQETISRNDERPQKR